MTEEEVTGREMADAINKVKLAFWQVFELENTISEKYRNDLAMLVAAAIMQDIYDTLPLEELPEVASKWMQQLNDSFRVETVN